MPGRSCYTVSAVEDLILRTGVDNSKLAAGLASFEAMVNARVAAIQAKMATIGNVGGVGGRMSDLERFGSGLSRVTGLSNNLTGSLNRMGSVFTGGLGIGIAVGGLGALVAAFERSIQKAKQFQTAQLAIAAQLQSSYKITGGISGKELTGPQAFQAAQIQSAKLNQEIIQRQARNILTYQEELNAFQSSLAAGSRKGLSTAQVLDISEQAAIVAKTMGLAGEQLANAARQLVGGGINVSRTVIGRALGIQNQDIASRSGPELMKFLQSKMSGFKTAEPEFAKSMAGIMSTLEARLDIFFSKVGARLFEKIQPAIEKLGGLLEGSGAEKFADVLVSLFNAVFSAIQTIANSPAIPIIIKFLEFLGQFGDKLLLAAIFTKLIGVLTGLAGSVRAVANEFTQMGLKAAGAGNDAGVAMTKAQRIAQAKSMIQQGLYGPSRGMPNAGEDLNRTGFIPIMGGKPSQIAPVEEPGLMQAPGTGGRTNLKQYTSEFEKNMAQRVAADVAMQTVSREAALEALVVGAAAHGPGMGLRERLAGYGSRAGKVLGGMGAIGAEALPNTLMGGMLGYAGGSMLAGAQAGGYGFTAPAQGGITAGGTAAGALGGLGMSLASMGVAITGPMVALAAGIVAVVAALGAFSAALSEAAEQQRKSEADLAAMYKEHPLTKLIAESEQREAAIRNRTRTTYAQPEFFGNFVGGGPLQGARPPLMPWQVAAIKQEQDRRAALKDIGTSQLSIRQGLVHVFDEKTGEDTTLKDIQARIQDREKGLKALEGGYVDPLFKAKQEAALAQSKLFLQRQSFTMNDKGEVTGGLALTDDQKARAAASFREAEGNRAFFRAKHGQEAELPKELTKHLTLGETEQDIAFAEDSTSIQKKAADEQKAIALKMQVAQNKLTSTKKDSKGQLDDQLVALEAQMRGEREGLGYGTKSDKAWEAFIQTAKDALIKNFNEPLKDLEAKIQTYDLAGIPKTTASMVKMAIDAVKAKIKEAGESAGLAAREIASLQAFAEAKQRSEALSARFGEAGSILTATGRAGEGQAAGLLAKSEASRFKYSPEAIAAAGFSSREQMVQAERAKDLQDAQDNARRKQLELQSAQISARQQQLAPTLASGGGPFGEVKSAIQYKVEAEKGFDPAAYERALRESQSLQEQEAEISRQRVKLDLAKAEKEYKDSLATVTALQNGRVTGGTAKGGLPGVGTALPNPKAEGVQSAVASGTRSAPGSTEGGITVNLNGNVDVPGVSKAELAAMLQEKVPQIIADYCQNKARTPK